MLEAGLAGDVIPKACPSLSPLAKLRHFDFFQTYVLRPDASMSLCLRHILVAIVEIASILHP